MPRSRVIKASAFCRACGASYKPRTAWQRFCRRECRYSWWSGQAPGRLNEVRVKELILEALRAEGVLSFRHDPQGGVLYLTSTPPRPAVVEEAGSVILRLDPETREVVGVTILNFSELWKDGLRQAFREFCIQEHLVTAEQVERWGRDHQHSFPPTAEPPAPAS